MKHRIFKVFLSFSIKAVNKDEVKVTLKEDLPEDTDLEGATITLTDAEGNTIEATIKEDTEAEGKAFTFVLPEGKELVDTEKYTVTSELFEDAEFQARVGEEYVKEITSPTTSVPALAEGVESVVVFEATNQYGEKIKFPTEGVTYEVTWKGMPLVKGDDKDFTAEKGKVTITKADIKEGDKLVVKVTYKDPENKDAEEVTAEKTFEVEKSAPAKVTEIVELKANTETVKPEDTVKVTATFKDQYGNAIELNENSKIRWVVEQGKDLIEIEGQAENTSVVTKEGSKANEFTYTAKLPGDVKIQAYITENGASAKTPYEVTIGKADLKSLTVTEVADLDQKKIYNNKANVIGTVAPNEGAELVPEDVKFEITDAEGKAVAPETATAVAKYAEPEEDAEDAAQEDIEKAIEIEFKATKSGEYTVTPYVEKDGKKIYALDGKNNKQGITVESKVENTVVDFTDVKFTKAEQKVNQPIEKDIEFVNEHGEPVLVATTENTDDKNRPHVYITSSNPDVGFTLKDVTKDGEVVGQKLVVEAKAKGKTVLTIQAGDEIKTYNLEFVDAKLTTVNFAKEKVKDAVAGDANLTEPKAQYNKVTFLDQDKQEMDVKDPAFAVTTADGKETDVNLGLELVKGAFNEKGDFVQANELKEDQKAEKFVKVSASKDVPAGTYTVKVAESDEALKDKDAKVGTFTVEVGAVRDVDKIKAEPKSSTVALNGEVKVDLTVLDQYGEAHSVEANTIEAKLIDPETEKPTEDTVTVTPVDQKDGKYTATVKPTKLGTYDLVFTYKKDEVEVTETVAVHVGIAADVVKSVEFADFEDEETERVLIKDGKPVYKSTQGQTYTLTPKAKDADGNPVNFNAEELTWTSSNPEFVSVEGGTVKVIKTPSKDEGDQKVTVTAKMLDVSQSITFVVSADSTPKALPESITMTVPTGKDKETLEVTEVTIDENAKDGAIEVTYTAVDQFGKDFNVDFTNTKIEVFNPTKAKAVQGSGNNTIKITAVGEGETKIRTTIDGNDVDLNVIVTKEAAEKAAETLAKAEQAVEDAKAKLAEANKQLTDAKTKLENLLKEGQTVEAAEQAVKDAQKAVKDAQKAVEDAKAAAEPKAILATLKEEDLTTDAGQTRISQEVPAATGVEGGDSSTDPDTPESGDGTDGDGSPTEPETPGAEDGENEDPENGNGEGENNTPEQGEKVTQKVVKAGETFNLATGYNKAVWVEVQQNDEVVGTGGMTEADGIAKINLTEAGEYTVVVKESENGTVLKNIPLTMTAPTQLDVAKELLAEAKKDGASKETIDAALANDIIKAAIAEKKEELDKEVTNAETAKSQADAALEALNNAKAAYEAAEKAVEDAKKELKTAQVELEKLTGEAPKTEEDKGTDTPEENKDSESDKE